MNQKPVIFMKATDDQVKVVGNAAGFSHLVTWCQTLYHTIFGPEEGERRLANLRFMDAILLYRAGGGLSLCSGAHPKA